MASNGKVQNNRHGERGIVYQTDVIKFLDVNDSQIFKTEIDTEHRASYFQLMEERLHMELWDRNGIWLNKFVGYLSIPILDIVSGSVKQ